MASAVAEARRVLKRGGFLLDIHPTDEPTTLHVWHARYALNGDLSEQPEALEAIHRAPIGELEHDKSLQDFTAATDALAGALESGFSLYRSATFDYRYFFDSLDELTGYLEDDWEHASASDTLLERALLAMQEATTPPKLVVVQRTVVTALRKI
ncbi:MAG: hypothetical protein ACRDH2_04520 [Anaerolineales bacterium]